MCICRTKSSQVLSLLRVSVSLDSFFSSLVEEEVFFFSRHLHRKKIGEQKSVVYLERQTDRSESLWRSQCLSHHHHDHQRRKRLQSEWQNYSGEETRKETNEEKTKQRNGHENQSLFREIFIQTSGNRSSCRLNQKMKEERVQELLSVVKKFVACCRQEVSLLCQEGSLSKFNWSLKQNKGSLKRMQTACHTQHESLGFTLSLFCVLPSLFSSLLLEGVKCEVTKKSQESKHQIKGICLLSLSLSFSSLSQQTMAGSLSLQERKLFVLYEYSRETEGKDRTKLSLFSGMNNKHLENPKDFLLFFRSPV